MNRNRWRWLAVLCMMVVTFLLGTDYFSSQNTRQIIQWIMSFFFYEAADPTRPALGEGWLRKSAHFLEYALLAWLWFRALRGDHALSWRWSWAAVAFLAASLWAGIDEIQQHYSAQRTGSPWDVLLDSSGALTAILLIGLTSFGQRLSADRRPMTKLV